MSQDLTSSTLAFIQAARSTLLRHVTAPEVSGYIDDLRQFDLTDVYTFDLRDLKNVVIAPTRWVNEDETGRIPDLARNLIKSLWNKLQPLDNFNQIVEVRALELESWVETIQARHIHTWRSHDPSYNINITVEFTLSGTDWALEAAFDDARTWRYSFFDPHRHWLSDKEYAGGFDLSEAFSKAQTARTSQPGGKKKMTSTTLRHLISYLSKVGAADNILDSLNVDNFNGVVIGVSPRDVYKYIMKKKFTDQGEDNPPTEDPFELSSPEDQGRWVWRAIYTLKGRMLKPLLFHHDGTAYEVTPTGTVQPHQTVAEQVVHALAEQWLDQPFYRDNDLYEDGTSELSLKGAHGKSITIFLDDSLSGGFWQIGRGPKKKYTWDASNPQAYIEHLAQDLVKRF